MSGRKHHYLPQLIQRPFAYRQQGKQFYVHAHHRSMGRFTPNTSGLGKELDFYGGPEDTNLDDVITRGEDALAETVQAINRGDAVAPADMATLVCALAFGFYPETTVGCEMVDNFKSFLVPDARLMARHVSGQNDFARSNPRSGSFRHLVPK